MSLSGFTKALVVAWVQRVFVNGVGRSHPRHFRATIAQACSTSSIVADCKIPANIDPNAIADHHQVRVRTRRHVHRWKSIPALFPTIDGSEFNFDVQRQRARPGLGHYEPRGGAIL